MNEVLSVVQETEILGKKVNLYRSIEEPLFEANEVAKWLDVKNVSQMIKQADIDDSEKGYIFKIYPWWKSKFFVCFRRCNV